MQLLRTLSVSILSASALSIGAVSAHAQTAITAAIPNVVAAGTKIELIKDGFEGTEGPIALKDGSVIFTETRANRITRIAADGSTSTFLENTNGSNGLAFTTYGDLISVQTVKPSVGVIYPAEHAKTLVDSFEGKPLNRPNDLVVDKRGGVYFTDPGAAPAAGQPSSQPAVYHLAANGTLTRIATDIERPNGIQLSPDEKTLYIANTNGEYVLAYDLAKDGAASNKRNFVKLDGYKQTETGYSSGADGLAVDAKGRLYVASNLGIQVFDAAGKALGVIALPKQPQNLAFGGKQKKTLYVVGRGAAYRFDVLTAGFNGRVK